MKPTLDDLLHNSLIATDIPSEELNERILNQSTQKEVVPMRKKETKKPWKMAQTAAAVALLVLVTGCGVYAAERILAQKQIAIIDNETEFMENATETTIHYEEFSGENLDFADSKVTDRTEELIQTSDFVGTVTEGTKDDLWSLKVEEKIDGKIEVGYVYPKLSDAFKDQNIGIDVSYIEANYPTLWSEKACQLCYDSRDADTFSRGAFFASYRKGDSQAVSIQYEVSDITNADDYIFKEAYDSTGTYTTADGVTLTITSQTADSGYTITYARMITEYTGLPVKGYNSGPLGGDQQLGALIADERISALIFFWDPMSAQPHDVDVKALLRLATLYNVPTAVNRSTADFLISSPLFEEEDYTPVVKDYTDYIQRSLK